MLKLIFSEEKKAKIWSKLYESDEILNCGRLSLLNTFVLNVKLNSLTT